MARVNDIRKSFFNEGASISELARTYEHDRKTIRKCISRDDWNEEPRHSTASPRESKLNPFKPVIDEWLQNDLRSRAKQRHTAKRVYNRLEDEYGQRGFNCSYRLVAIYVAFKKKELKLKREGYMPLEHKPGEAQIDFGEADFRENGIMYHGHYLNISFPYSNAGYLQLFKGQNCECLLEGLKTFFNYIDGVPSCIWFDNASTAVVKILKDGKRELTDAYQRFIAHYGFDSVFCNPGKGNEKGSVENKVGYHRRNLLVPIPEFNNLTEYNRELLRLCDEDMNRPHYRKETIIRELFEEDLNVLKVLPSTPLDVCRYDSIKTDGYGKFTLNQGRHQYSTAPKFANGTVTVKITAHEIIVLDENTREVVRHRRLYGDGNQESMDWIPYLSGLAKYPTALKYSGVYEMLPDPVKDYMDGCTRTARGEALKLLASLTAQSGFEKAASVFEDAIRRGVQDLDSVLTLHARLNQVNLDLPPVQLPVGTPEISLPPPNLGEYDTRFLRGERLC